MRSEDESLQKELDLLEIEKMKADIALHQWEPKPDGFWFRTPIDEEKLEKAFEKIINIQLQVTPHTQANPKSH